MTGETRGWGAVVSGAEIGRQEILHRPKDAWHLVRQGLRQHLLLFPERRLSLFVCLFISLYPSLVLSLLHFAFIVHARYTLSIFNRSTSGQPLGRQLAARAARFLSSSTAPFLILYLSSFSLFFSLSLSASPTSSLFISVLLNT